MGSPVAPNPIVEELRQLFSKAEYESVVVRAEHLQKRKKFDDAKSNGIVDAVRAFSMIHLGRSSDALDILKELPAANQNFAQQVTYAKLYASWAVNENVSEAIDQVSQLGPGPDAKRLEAQLLYRSGRYEEAADRYGLLLKKAKQDLEEKKRPAAASRWGLASMTGRSKSPSHPVTAAELDQLTNAVNELATNTMASLVLAGQTDAATEIRKGLRPSYELEYNSACALIDRERYEDAENGLEKAEALIRAELDEEEEDIDEAIAPVCVQKAYLKHLAGDVETAEKNYASVVTERKADAGSLAVAANNLTVALGQRAFGRNTGMQSGRLEGQGGKTLPKEQYDALAEGLKKMRATSGRNVERKLTTNQRRAMARNRAILLVQMGRADACRTELARVKAEFPDDPVVPLIEATLVARQSNLETADKILQRADGDENMLAARVQLAASQGDHQGAAKLLQNLFPGKPAAIVTAAALLERDGDIDVAIEMLRGLVSEAKGSSAGSAKKALAKMLLRNERYEEAAIVLQDVCAANSQDFVALAQLAVATTYVDPEEAAQIVGRLPEAKAFVREIDVKLLESLPPPKRKHIAKKIDKPERHALRNTENTATDVAAPLRERKKKKKKKRLPTNYDPNGPPPDPERWLPKQLRSSYKKKKTKTDQNSFTGAQGADAAAAEAASVKNAERSAARAAASASEGPLPPSGRSKLQRKKKNRR